MSEEKQIYLLPTKPDGRKPKNPQAYREPEQREHDLFLIAGEYLRGKSTRDIVEAVNRQYQAMALDIHVTAIMIREDIKEIHKRWVNSSLIDFNEAKGRELAKLDELEAAYWQAYEESMKDKEMRELLKTTDMIAFAVDQVVPVTRTRKKHRIERRDPLMSALAGVERCIEQRCKILGLFSPEKFQVDWRVEAVRAGLPENKASQIFEELVDKYVNSMELAAEGSPPDTE